MKILSKEQISQKIRRLAIEILEHNYDAKEIYLAGINNNGMGFAKLIMKEISGLSDLKIHLISIKLNPAKPISEPVTLSIDPAELKNKVIIIVDDVANTGRTIFYSYKAFMEVVPKKMEVAVLIDRKHKSFPVKVDYLGLSLATTLKNNIDVRIQNKKEQAVYLD